MIFDFHYHLLFKHYVSKNQALRLNENVQVRGIPKLFNQVFGEPFSSQSSPALVSKSQLQIGVIGLLAVEHAFANRVMHILDIDMSNGLPIDWNLFDRIKKGQTNYYDEFKNQVSFYGKFQNELEREPYNIFYLNRGDFTAVPASKIEQMLQTPGKRYMCFSIEGGHNLSNVPIRQGVKSETPEAQLKEIQENSTLDFISINLCHLSEIPEQHLGTFAQGMTSAAKLAFSSEDFMPKTGFGLSELGKKVIKQALTHAERPILIDVKHASLYTRLQYYDHKKTLEKEFSAVNRLPIISSHTGFVFTSVKNLLDQKLFRSETKQDGSTRTSKISSQNRKIGKTDDTINSGLYANPWTINLFDEDIVAIFQSRGLIGISMDQRILGATKSFLDSDKTTFFDEEYIPFYEWKKLFSEGQLPEREMVERGVAPSRPERHIMLLCLHIVYAVRIGYELVEWSEGESPWDHICMGSDYDGLINPINGFDTIADCNKLRDGLIKYLPQADKTLTIRTRRKAFEYGANDTILRSSLETGIEKFLFKNGQKFITRFLKNWN